MLRDGIASCPCKRTQCPFHARCDQCIERHAGKKRPPYCEQRPEKGGPKSGEGEDRNAAR